MTGSVSAIIAVYNGEQFIEEAIQSLVDQTFKLSKIIIVDDGSLDNTQTIVRKMQTNNSIIELLINEQNSGVSISRNRGCATAQTEWIMFLDADDVVRADLVEKMLTKKVSSTVVLIHTAYQQIDHQGNAISEVSRFKQVNADEILGYEFVRNYIYLSGTLVRRSCFNSCGGFNINISLCEDWDLWLKMAQKGSFNYIDDVLLSVRRHKSNVSINIDTLKESSKVILNQYSYEFIKQAVEKRNLSEIENSIDFVSILYFLGNWQEGLDILQPYLNTTSSDHALLFYVGLFYLHQKDIKTAAKYFRRATEINKMDAASWNNRGVCAGLMKQPLLSEECFIKAINIHVNYIDANENILLLEQNKLIFQYKITWKQLRTVLLNYQK